MHRSPIFIFFIYGFVPNNDNDLWLV